MTTGARSSSTARLQAALRAEDALIVEAQTEVERYLSKQIESAELVDRLIGILDGEKQREVQRLAHEVLAESTAFKPRRRAHD